MTKRLLHFIFLLAYVSPLLAIQEDITPILRHPDFLFSNNESEKIIFISDKAFKMGFGAYLLSDANHAWQFKSGGDLSVFSFGQNDIWRSSFLIEGLADAQNPDFRFRMRQTGYDISTAYEHRFGHNVLSVGYHHRCRHGSDQETDQMINDPIPTNISDYQSRILMRSGLEIGYNALFKIKNFNLILNNIFNSYLWGQNIDTKLQPRLSIASIFQAEYPISSNLTPFISTGLGMSWVTSGSTKTYYLWSKIESSEWRFTPAASIGLSILGKLGEFRIFIAYNSKIDTGFGKNGEKTHLVTIAGEFWL